MSSPFPLKIAKRLSDKAKVFMSEDNTLIVKNPDHESALKEFTEALADGEWPEGFKSYRYTALVPGAQQALSARHWKGKTEALQGEIKNLIKFGNIYGESEAGPDDCDSCEDAEEENS